MPNWTEIIQAICAVVVVPVTLITLWKLVKRDRERESEIHSLETIADKLTLMLEDSNSRFILSKKPIITILLYPHSIACAIAIEFINSNPNSTMVSYDVLDTDTYKVQVSEISFSFQHNQQTFKVIVDGSTRPIFFLNFKMNYIVDPGLVFEQKIEINSSDGGYKITPGLIYLVSST